MLKSQKKKIKDSVKYSMMLRRRFEELNIPLSKKNEGIPTDLGDIYEICLQYIGKLEQIFSPEAKKNKKIQIDFLKYFLYQFDYHIKFHLKEIKKPLLNLLKEMEDKQH